MKGIEPDDEPVNLCHESWPWRTPRVVLTETACASRRRGGGVLCAVPSSSARGARDRRENEQIEALSRAQGQDRISVVCECADLDCAVQLPLSLGTYEAARRDPRLFIVAPGHDDPDLEVVVAERDDYTLVLKIGEAAEEARVTDPR